MFLLHPSIFLWDLTILLLISFGLCIAIICTVWCKQNPTKHIFKKGCVGFLGFAGFIGFLLTAYGSFVEPRLITLNEYDVHLPLRTPLKIAVLSDLHVGPYKGKLFLERVVERTNELLPDLVLLLGDFIFDPDVDLSAFSPLGNLHPSIGTYAVLGNHDQGQYQSIFGKRIIRPDLGDNVSMALSDLGITVLRNEHVTIPIVDESLVLAGIDDIWTAEADLDSAFADVSPYTPLILLVHNPSIVDDPQSRAAHLIVAGHTHGGQIRLPWIGPIPPLPTTLGPSVDQGIFPIDTDSTLAITRGIGETNARARLFAPPEIMLLHVR
ncbi:metallophosphoesterase [Candidatus Peregrinibacteria bacterium]|nr:metallophosphoesterase [Candidatus Peregrinibacteria bacterium]